MRNTSKAFGILGAATATLILGSSQLQAAVDVFDLFFDGDDTANPAWTHHSGLAGSSGQSWTVAGGAYRLQAPNNGVILSGAQYGYVGSLVGSVNADVRVEADFLDWNQPGGVFGIGARWTTTGGFNNLTGYGYAYEPFASGGLGEMVLYEINGLNLQDRGSQQVTLDPLKNYTFVLDITGNTLTGQVIEIGGGKVAEKIFVDTTPYLSGQSSVFGYSATGLPTTDFTVDNVIVLVPEPSTYVLLGLGALGVIFMRRNRHGRI